MTSEAAETAGVEPTFRHLDDIEWTPVQRQQNADGSVSVVREKWPIIRPGFLSAHVTYEPGMVVRRHGHRSNHVVFVLDGSGWFGDHPCTPGTHAHVPLGAAFGPIVAGPTGLTCWELSFGEFGGWGDQPELYERAIHERGITPLPDPPIELGDWFVDPRGDWGGERPSPKVDGLAEVITHLDQFVAGKTERAGGDLQRRRAAARGQAMLHADHGGDACLELLHEGAMIREPAGIQDPVDALEEALAVSRVGEADVTRLTKEGRPPPSGKVVECALAAQSHVPPRL